MHTLAIPMFLTPTWIENVFLSPIDLYFYIISLKGKMDNLPTKTDITYLGIVTTVSGLILGAWKLLTRRKQNVEQMYVKDRSEQSKEWLDLIAAGKTMFDSMLALEKKRSDVFEQKEMECEKKLEGLTERVTVCERQRANQEVRIAELERIAGGGNATSR